MLLDLLLLCTSGPLWCLIGVYRPLQHPLKFLKQSALQPLPMSQSPVAFSMPHLKCLPLSTAECC